MNKMVVLIGIALMFLGLFGGKLGIPGLEVVNTYWGPENATLCVYPVASPNEPNWVIEHYWYGYSDTEPGVYHLIDGSEVKVYIDGQYYTTLVTNRDQARFYTPLYKLSAGTHEIRFVYEGTPGEPYPPDEVVEYVTISSSGNSTTVNQSQASAGPNQPLVALGCVTAAAGILMPSRRER